MAATRRPSLASACLCMCATLLALQLCGAAAAASSSRELLEVDPCSNLSPSGPLRRTLRGVNLGDPCTPNIQSGDLTLPPTGGDDEGIVESPVLSPSPAPVTIGSGVDDTGIQIYEDQLRKAADEVVVKALRAPSPLPAAPSSPELSPSPEAQKGAAAPKGAKRGAKKKAAHKHAGKKNAGKKAGDNI